MPSKSKKQHNLMEMVAHDPAAAKKVGIPAKVGKDFVAADTGMDLKNLPKVKKAKTSKSKVKFPAPRKSSRHSWD